MSYVVDEVDVIVVGAGHAGCEAGLSSARLGLNTIMFTMNLDSVALMPCNPNIGGSSKGHLVKEIDALGGEMGKNADKTFIQSRMLNTGKGPAVYSLRVQVDKSEYTKEMKKTIENTDKLFLKQDEVIELIIENKKVKGVKTVSGNIYKSRAVVLATGTYLNAKCLYGNTVIHSGPNGLSMSKKLGDYLDTLEIKKYRFKTGSPARVDGRTLDYDKMEIQKGDEKIVPFSFENLEKGLTKDQVPCYLTYTNKETHKIINDNIDKSPMYSGEIKGISTRYCPSIEDKIVRFKDKDRHQVFVEPEGINTNEMYIQGMSSSLPEDVQIEMYRTMKGLENCKFTRTAYAIEYDCIDSTALKLTLEFKNIKGLFSAGQFNGSSGYEEAGAQGIIAGINAGLQCLEKEPLIIDRSQGYIGVLIDDLVTKGTKEPYRMMTSRAEYRLLLRQDNADIRLSKIGYEVGLLSKERYEKLQKKIEHIENELERLEKVTLPPTKALNEVLEKNNSSKLSTGIKLNDLIKRPEVTYEMLKDFDFNRKELLEEVKDQVNIQIKYEGYINRQLKQVNQFKKLENKKLDSDFNYDEVRNLTTEAKQKLNFAKPENIGHASRITGVSPADISVLLVHLEKNRRRV